MVLILEKKSLIFVKKSLSFSGYVSMACIVATTTTLPSSLFFGAIFIILYNFEGKVTLKLNVFYHVPSNHIKPSICIPSCQGLFNSTNNISICNPMIVEMCSATTE